MDMYYGNIIKCENGKYILYKEKATLTYDDELKCFVLIDNDYIAVFDDLMTGYIKKEKEIDERMDAISDHFLTCIPKQEEGYMFIDESSLENYEKREKPRKK